MLATLATRAHRQPAAPTATSTAAALNSGYHLAYLIGAALVGVALVIALVVLRSPAAAGAPAEAKQERMEPALSEAA